MKCSGLCVCLLSVCTALVVGLQLAEATEEAIISSEGERYLEVKCINYFLLPCRANVS